MQKLELSIIAKRLETIISSLKEFETIEIKMKGYNTGEPILSITTKRTDHEDIILEKNG